jgi:hypothetical protein
MCSACAHACEPVLCVVACWQKDATWDGQWEPHLSRVSAHVSATAHAVELLPGWPAGDVKRLQLPLLPSLAVCLLTGCRSADLAAALCCRRLATSRWRAWRVKSGWLR